MTQTTSPDPRKPEALSLAPAGGRRLITATVLFSVFTNLLMLTGPLFMLQVYDRVLGSRSEETLVALFALVAGLYFFYGILEYARGRTMARLGARFQSLMTGRVFGAAIERAALLRKSGPGATALQDLDAIRSFLTAPVLLALLDAPWTPVFLCAIFIFHPMLGWLALAGGSVLILAALANQLLTRRMVGRAVGQSQQAAEFARTAEDGGDLVWAQGMGPAMTERYRALQDTALRGTMSSADWTGSFTSFSKAFRFFLQSAMLALGAWLVLQGQITAGAMIAASILLGRALAPIEQALGQWPLVQRARSGWTALSDFMAAVPERQTPTPLPRPEARLDVQNLAVVTALGVPPILQGISFQVTPGEALGVIGKSGAGKTTLARVLMGLIRPTAGEVRLAGATLDQFGPERLGDHIGYLPQDVRLFGGTVAENIARMALEPDAEKVVAAAKQARVHEVILGLPKGYDTPLGAADAQLSGGQKQRVALARALYGDPVLLVLDEPNSALDADGSEALNAAVSAIKAEGGAVIIMTHRPTAISTCDRLLVLDSGRVAGYGPRDEIIRKMMQNAGDVQRVVGTAKST
ncbi:MAG: type I secretion system permease/ATPase [Alphaproteobacteria bacterium]|nr:type I secretion system permease/ATPase [Alphaproteobacteria bacterium]